MRIPTKILRKIRRDVNPGLTTGVAAVGSSLIVTGAATIATGGAMAPLMILSFIGIFAGEGVHDYSHSYKVSNGALDINGFRLVGDNAALSRIKNTQYLFDKKTHDMQHMEHLPDGFMKAYLADAAEALRQVTVYKNGKVVAPEEFTLNRKCYDDHGNKATEQIGVIPRQLVLPPGAVSLDGVRQVGGTGDMKSIGPGFNGAADAAQQDIPAQLAPKRQSPKP